MSRAPKPLFEAAEIDIGSLVRQYVKENFGSYSGVIAFYYADKFKVRVFGSIESARWYIENVSPSFYMELYSHGEYIESNAEYWERNKKELPFDLEE